VVRRGIIDAAAGLLRERTLESITALDIAEAAGSSRPTFYMYFESKHAVVAELADETLGRVYDTLWRRAFDGDPEVGPPGTTEHWQRTIAAWREHAPILVSAAEGWRRDPAVYARWGVRMRGFVAIMASYIDHARASGTAQPQPDSATLAELLMWHAETILYVVLAGLAPEFDDDTLLADGLSAVWLRAVHGGSPA
jgi:AcrR family transcriptional regulator